MNVRGHRSLRVIIAGLAMAKVNGGGVCVCVLDLNSNLSLLPRRSRAAPSPSTHHHSGIHPSIRASEHPSIHPWVFRLVPSSSPHPVGPAARLQRRWMMRTRHDSNGDYDSTRSRPTFAFPVHTHTHPKGRPRRLQRWIRPAIEGGGVRFKRKTAAAPELRGAAKPTQPGRSF